MKHRITYTFFRLLIPGLSTKQENLDAKARVPLMSVFLVFTILAVLVAGHTSAQEFDLSGNWRLLIRGASSNCPENLKATGKYKLTERALAIIEAESIPANVVLALQSLIGVSHSTEGEFVAALKNAVQNVVNYRLTSLPALKDALLSQVEEDVLEPLEELIDIAYSDETAFIAVVEEKIGPVYTNLYKSQILEVAKVEGSTGYKLTDLSFPELRQKLSATFQNDILDKLTGLVDMLYTDSAGFLNGVRGSIGDDLTALYGSTIAEIAEEKGMTDHIRAMIVRDRPTFIIDQQYIKDLSARSIPTETLNQLKTLKDQSFNSETSFTNELNSTIGVDETNTYKDQILENAAVRIHECGEFANLDNLVMGISQDEYENFEGKLSQATGTDPAHIWDWVKDWDWKLLLDPYYEHPNYKDVGDILNGRIRKGRVSFKIKDSPAIEPPVSGGASFTSSGTLFQGMITGDDLIQGIFYGNGALPLSSQGKGNVPWSGFFLITPAPTTVSPLLGGDWTVKTSAAIPPFIRQSEKILKFLSGGPFKMIQKKMKETDELKDKTLLEKLKIVCKVDKPDITEAFAFGEKISLCDGGSQKTDYKFVGTIALKPLLGLTCKYPLYGIPYIAELNAVFAIQAWLRLTIEDESNNCVADEFIIGPWKIELTVPVEGGVGVTLLVVLDLRVVFYFNTSAAAQVKYDLNKIDQGDDGFCDGSADFTGTGGVKIVAKYLFWTDVLWNKPFTDAPIKIKHFELSEPCN